jgi:antitoxin component HigA of HigAB toxin-antitoxin module
MKLLEFVVQDYEATFEPLPETSPAEVVGFLLAQGRFKPEALSPYLGSKSNVEAFLAGRYVLTALQAGSLAQALNIPVGLLEPKPVRKV